MKNTSNQQQRNTTRLRTLSVATLTLGCAFIMVPGAGAQSLTPPATPTDITPPAGNSLFFGGPRSGNSRVCLSAHRCGGVYGVLDRQGRSPRSNSVPDHLRADIPDHHAFPQPRYQPERRCTEPSAFRQRDVAEFA